MRYFVIGDEDTVLGFRYAGVRGRVVESPTEARTALQDALGDATIGVLIVTEQAAEAIRADIDAVLLGRELPVIVEVPDRSGPLPGRKTLVEIIRQAVGMGV